jgi:predicted nucleic acid-binding protein
VIRVCVDSGFLIGLYDESDDYHERAGEHFVNHLDSDFSQLLIPWPILYESVSTKMSRRQDHLASLERDWRKLKGRGRLVLLDDRDFRERAMEECLSAHAHLPIRYRPLSLADRVLRHMLSEIKVDVFITFNEGDFADVCARRGQTLVGK